MPSNAIRFFVIIFFAVIGVAAMFGARRLLIDTNPITVSVLYSTEKEAWLEAAINDFDEKINGRSIEILTRSMGSGEIIEALVNSQIKPDLISPASSVQISMLEDRSPTMVNSASCRSTLSTPLVLVAWHERVDALGWLSSGQPDMWEKLHDAVADPQGWATYGQPNWGFVKFGHTRPDTSNSGLLTIMLITYDYFDKSSGLTVGDVLSDDYNSWLQKLAREVEVGNSTGTLMEQLIAFGPSKFDMVAVYEATAIAQVGNAVGRYGDLGIFYPPATVLSDHPFCALNAPWVTAEKGEAAQKFVDYLLSRPVQEQALELGFRPADASISLTGGNTPFDRLVQNGIQIDLPPQVEVPPGDVLDALIRTWERNSR